MNIGRPLQWRHNGHDCVSNHWPRHCLLNRLLRHRSKKTSVSAQMTSNAENVSIWWRHHANCFLITSLFWISLCPWNVVLFNLVIIFKGNLRSFISGLVINDVKLISPSSFHYRFKKRHKISDNGRKRPSFAFFKTVLLLDDSLYSRTCLIS